MDNRKAMAAAAALLSSAAAFAQPLQFITNEPNAGFVDISSGMGATVLNLGDDAVANVPVNNGNALFGAGVWTISNNGGMGLNVPLPNQFLPPVNAPILPNAHPMFGSTPQALAPGWDDEGGFSGLTSNVYVLDDSQNLNMLIVQYENLPVGNLGTSFTTFQVQIPYGTFLEGGVYARFIYEDVDDPECGNGSIFSIGYQDGSLGQFNNAFWSFNAPNSISNGLVLSLTTPAPGAAGALAMGLVVLGRRRR